jgi:hypothetical protein
MSFARIELAVKIQRTKPARATERADCPHIRRQWSQTFLVRKSVARRSPWFCTKERFVYGVGQFAPVEIQASMRAPNSACVPGAGERPSPGFHAHPTSGSVDACSWIFERLRPPFRASSFNCKQISPKDFPCHAIEAGARLQRGLPGMLEMEGASVVAFAFPWHDLHGNPGTPWSPGPACNGGKCECRSLPCVGWRVAGWQFMQRGLWITLAASVKSATDLARSSPIAEKEEAARSEVP